MCVGLVKFVDIPKLYHLNIDSFRLNLCSKGNGTLQFFVKKG